LLEKEASMTQNTVVDLTPETFDAAVAAEGAPLLVEFWSDSCMPCHRLAPVLKDMAVEYAGTLRIAKVKCDEHLELGERFGIQGVPAFFLFEDGEQLVRFGANDKDGILEQVLPLI
jgi:thioredoxin 1